MRHRAKPTIVDNSIYVMGGRWILVLFPQKETATPIRIVFPGIPLLGV
jgi:hypothetical protein